MYRTIIVPLDGSTRSHAALPVAARLARACGARLVLARVHIDERPDLAHDPSWDAMFREGEQRYLDTLAPAYESTIGQEIGVAADGGVVTLSGAVPTYAEKVAARHAAKRVAGVRAVTDELVVATLVHHIRSDTAIARAIAASFDLNVQIPTSAIAASVSEGWVTLEGTVDWQYQRDAATYAVCMLAGVRGVSNFVEVVPVVATPTDVTHRIETALRRSAELDCKNIVVQIDDGRVTLRGTVRSWAERQDAERAAWSAPGVRAVIDRLLVAL